MPYSSKIQQRPTPLAVSESPKRPQRLGVGHLGIDIHRHVDLSVTEYPHGHSRMNVERREQSGAHMPGVVDCNTTDSGPGAASLKAPVEVARLERRPRQGREHEPGFGPVVGGYPLLSADRPACGLSRLPRCGLTQCQVEEER
jgi:hypothetical protein